MAATVVDVGDIRQESVFLSNDKRPVISGTTGIRKKRSQSSNHRQKTHGLERDTRAPRTQTLCSWSLDPRRTPDPVMNPLPEKPGEKGMDPCRAWTTISRMYGCIKKQIRRSNLERRIWAHRCGRFASCPFYEYLSTIAPCLHGQNVRLPFSVSSRSCMDHFTLSTRSRTMGGIGGQG